MVGLVLALLLANWSTPTFLQGGFYAGLITKPVLSQFTAVNTGSVTEVDSSVGINMQSTSNGSNNNIAMLNQTPPAAPYTYTALLANASFQGNTSGGICLYDGTKVEGLFVSWDQSTQVMRFNVSQYTNVTTFSTNASSMGIIPTNLLWLRIYNDATTLHYYWSSDGVNFSASSYTEAVGTFITPTNVGLCVNAYAAQLNFTFESWLQT